MNVARVGFQVNTLPRRMIARTRLSSNACRRIKIKRRINYRVAKCRLAISLFKFRLAFLCRINCLPNDFHCFPTKEMTRYRCRTRSHIIKNIYRTDIRPLLCINERFFGVSCCPRASVILRRHLFLCKIRRRSRRNNCLIQQAVPILNERHVWDGMSSSWFDNFLYGSIRDLYTNLVSVTTFISALLNPPSIAIRSGHRILKCPI